MKPGKLPSELLARLIERLPADPRLLLGPGIGRDAAAIDLGGGRVLVAKADPITFAVEEIGRYAVHVNANDVVCLGARPAWFLATVLLPAGSSPAAAEEIFEQVRSACEELGVVPVGGHTEITIGLTRPIVSGAMLGETSAEALVRPDGARDADHLLLTKGIAVEGTAVLAREATEALQSLGLEESLIRAARRLLVEPGISVVREALAVSGPGAPSSLAGAVHALHDPTEGGLATALVELAQAAGLRVRVRREDIVVLPETRSICEVAGLDPLGLLASGSLLIAVAPDGCDDVLAALERVGVSASCIGDLASGGGDVIIERWGQEPLPRFERDELARFLEAPQGRAEE